ncbi:MAG: RNA methyltransferase, partial [Clostridia bacterium]|nr:RNA methyltransferase [Clostridia bacterium]
MLEIESIRNPRIQALRKLTRARERRALGRFLVEGPRMAEEALAAGLCETVLISRSQERTEAAAEWAEAKGLEVVRVSEAIMESLSENRTPQGILCVCRIPEEKKPDGPLILALDAVQNPGNVGTMIRTADAAGFAGILLGSGCADLYGSKTLAATMGSVFHLPVATVPDLAGTLHAYAEAGYAVIATELGGADFYEDCPGSPAILVIGNEGNGISGEVSGVATLHLALPMRGGAES